jgi:hypothetical protein
MRLIPATASRGTPLREGRLDSDAKTSRHRAHFNTDSSASYLNRNGLTIEALGRYRRELPIASSGARRLVKAMICAGGQDRMPTNKRERVYIYASMTPADQEE